jgi:membrane-bound metal-dependent hydrolase YbcI (DUF457 family)
MDFFTHIMIGFIISSIASGSFYNKYVLFGTFMAALPDFDVFLYPLWRRLPITRHHGATHMIIFIVIVSAFIDILLAVFTGGVDVKLFLLMCITGISHVFGDFITTWGVSPFYPLVKRYTKLNLDAAVNPYLILYFFIAVLFLASVWSGHIPIGEVPASALLGATYIAYFAARAALKLYYTSRPSNEEFTALPTFSPFRWKFVKKIETGDEIKVVIKNGPTMDYVIPKGGLRDIKTCEDLIYTYWHPNVQEYMRTFSYPYYKVDCRDGKREIDWFSAEMGDNMSIRVKYDGRLEFENEFKSITKTDK